MILIRPFSHGNEVSIFYDEAKKIFSKITFTSTGKSYVLNEKMGIQWYATNNNKDINKFISSSWNLKNYCRLDLKKINGRIYDYNLSLSKNLIIIENSILHYCNIWPKKKIVPCHGDLTIDNIIYNKGKIVFYDWEHFNLDGEKWGFDIVYLVLSSILLPNFFERSIPRKDLKIFSHLWRSLINLGVDISILNDPFPYYDKVFNGSKFWKLIIANSPSKMFPLVTDESLKIQINKEIKKLMSNV